MPNLELIDLEDLELGEVTVTSVRDQAELPEGGPLWCSGPGCCSGTT